MNSTGRSPKRELQLQGPRPTPLRINKDSHKIKKPPLPPPPQPKPPRPPVIIYTVSPKIIHTTPSDFMSLVQRLTGSSSSSSITSNKASSENTSRGEISPAARYAAIEKARVSHGMKRCQIGNSCDVEEVKVEHPDHAVERSNVFHGILSPGPASLSPIPSTLFSPPSAAAGDGTNMVTFLHDLSPVLNKSFMEGNFIMPSPLSFISPHAPSFDLFNNFSN